MSSKKEPTQAIPIPFRAEIKQLLDIIIYSLYKEREIFLRELISNASDALNRIRFEMLTNKNVVSPDAELSIRIIVNEEDKTLSIEDTGIGMTREELSTNLGTIAQSGAAEFLRKVKDGENDASEIIGRFGVGFYSAFMVAESIRVTSRSYNSDEDAAVWSSSGSEDYTIEPATKNTRGTKIEMRLKEDALEFLKEYRIKELIRKHSDFISFPIFVGKDTAQTNAQTAIWREKPYQVEDEKYHSFYKQMTYDFTDPLTTIHMNADAPVQIFALLFIPSKLDQNLMALRKDRGIKLYSHKVMIQEYCKDLLPEYLSFLQGVVESDDLPLNVSREMVQSTVVMDRIKKAVTHQVMNKLKKMMDDEPENYEKFWLEYGKFLRHGVASENTDKESLFPYLRFHTNKVQDHWSSLEDYTSRMKPDQKEIYYILGDDDKSTLRSPHLDYFDKDDYEVLLLTDPFDSFMLFGLNKYQDHELKNVASTDVQIPQESEEGEPEGLSLQQFQDLIIRFKNQLGDKVKDVRSTKRLTDSPARLVSPEGAINEEMQRVYKLLDKEFVVPQKILELNPKHPLLVNLNKIPVEDELSKAIVDQVYESALLIEGIHPDPASMIHRIQQIMEAAVGK